MRHQLLRYIEYSQRPPSGCNFASTLHSSFLTGATLTGVTEESLEDASGRETLASSRPGVEPKGGSQETENSKWSLCASRPLVWDHVSVDLKEYHMSLPPNEALPSNTVDMLGPKIIRDG